MRKNKFDSDQGRWLMLLALLIAMLALSGCVVRPVVADWPPRIVGWMLRSAPPTAGRRIWRMRRSWRGCWC